jgi:hypothetical protein
MPFRFLEVFPAFREEGDTISIAEVFALLSEFVSRTLLSSRFLGSLF